jgi:hypothetical protein
MRKKSGFMLQAQVYFLPAQNEKRRDDAGRG